MKARGAGGRPDGAMKLMEMKQIRNGKKKNSPLALALVTLAALETAVAGIFALAFAVLPTSSLGRDGGRISNRIRSRKGRGMRSALGLVGWRRPPVEIGSAPVLAGREGPGRRAARGGNPLLGPGKADRRSSEGWGNAGNCRLAEDFEVTSHRPSVRLGQLECPKTLGDNVGGGSDLA